MIRKIKQDDAVRIERLLSTIPNFTDNEVNVAMELVNIAASNEFQTDYNIYVYDFNDEVLGYHCTGRRPLTDGVYDLYWIVSDQKATVKGIGRELLEHAEKFVVDNNGRWLLAETSSKESYQATRNFYLRNNYSIVAQINDFYSKGDNLIVFGKFFSL
ncbi:MAG: GNAT family N-acetyltransferase [Ignavibacteriales bacterium]|nr:MAG: GNAT family N-acetyltransferase [Ignavibacteriales bacterium]